MPPDSHTLALFGGAFDPPHVGHVLAAHYVLLTARVDRILVVPCGEHPFGKRQAPFPHRLAMCRAAFAHLEPRVEVLDIEGRRPGASYTVDTVRTLIEKHPGARIEIVVGSDTLDDLDQWHEIDALRRLAAFRVLPRLGAAPESPTPDGEDALFCLPRVSSTEVRRLLAHGDDVSNRLPRAVVDHIREHGLYRPAR